MMRRAETGLVPAIMIEGASLRRWRFLFWSCVFFLDRCVDDEKFGSYFNLRW